MQISPGLASLRLLASRRSRLVTRVPGCVRLPGKNSHGPRKHIRGSDLDSEGVLQKALRTRAPRAPDVCSPAPGKSLPYRVAYCGLVHGAEPEGLTLGMANDRCALERLSKDLNTAILKMGGLVEEMLVGAVDALGRQDAGSARAIVTRRGLVDRHGLGVDDLCLSFLPGNGNDETGLRLATATMAIARDLEHMAGLAVDVAECALEATSRPPSRPLVDLHRLEDIARRMLRDTLDAYVRRSAPLARSIFHDENEEDSVCHALGNDLASLMMEDSSQVPGSVPLLLASRDVRRVCTHVTRMARSIVFLVEGIPAPAAPLASANGGR